MIDELPNYLVLDLELARPLERGKDVTKLPISVLSGWGLRDIAPFVWLLDSSRLPRVLLTEDHLEKVFARYDGIVTWNGKKLDGPVLARRMPKLAVAIRKKPHIDLHAICCLLQAGVEPEKIAAGIDENWPKLVPTIREDLLNAGWNLGAVGAGTLGLDKLDGPQGAEAVKAWEDGRWSEVISYNIHDTGMTRELLIFAWTHGFLKSAERPRVDIPRLVLGG